MNMRRTWSLVALMTAVVMVVVPQAHAEEEGGAREPNGSLMSGPPGTRAVSSTTASKVEYERYWWQNLIVDAASLALASSAGAFDQSPGGENLSKVMFISAAVGYGMGSPIVHMVHHRNVNRALLSLLLRAGLPLAGGYVGTLLPGCRQEEFVCGETAIGMLAGLGAALAIDYVWLARKRVERVPARGLSIVPSVSPSQDAVVLGLSGRF